MLAAAKAGLDGMADAIGVDDSFFRISFSVSPKTENKMVVSIDYFKDDENDK